MSTENVNRRPAPFLVGAFATQIWMNWAWIALDNCDAAAGERNRHPGPPVDNPELQASMVCITAAVAAIDGFAAAIEEHGISPELPGRKTSPPRATIVWEILRANFDVNAKTQDWPPRLKDLWALRNVGLVHQASAYGDRLPLPAFGSAPARATYTVENSIAAVELMAEVMSACTVQTLRPGPSAGMLDRVQGFATYVDEYVARAGRYRAR